MKTRLLLLLTALPLLTASCSQEDNSHKNKNLIDPGTVVHNPRTINGIPANEALTMPVMTFKDTTHSFGTISEGERVSYDFSFSNTGAKPLLIQSAEATCGCTVADYPKDPIAPGKEAVMKVVFNSAGKQGHQEKDIAITANTIKGVQHLYIQADVTPESK